ncbi:MAG: histone H1 [Muribaculaceae bacterium]|nr:histone H1 [Muribaculaceae bacterium]
MKELFDNIQAKMIEFSKDLNLNVNKGNKSAGVRARKASLELEKMFKEYRKVSLKMAKK